MPLGATSYPVALNRNSVRSIWITKSLISRSFIDSPEQDSTKRFLGFVIEISFVPATLIRAALKGIALGIRVAPLCANPMTHFLAIFDIEFPTMRLAFAGNYGETAAKNAFAVAQSAQLVAPLLGYLCAFGKFILNLGHQAVGYLVSASIIILSSRAEPS